MPQDTIVNVVLTDSPALSRQETHSPYKSGDFHGLHGVLDPNSMEYSFTLNINPSHIFGKLSTNMDEGDLPAESWRNVQRYSNALSDAAIFGH